MTTTIVALIGVRGSGKTRRAAEFVRAGNYVPIDFKDPLIDMAYAVAGEVTTDSFKSDGASKDLRYENFKQHVVGLSATRIRRAVSRVLQLMFPDNMLTGRKLLQRLGTDAVRKRTPEYWTSLFRGSVNLAARRGMNIVCADTRYANELNTIIDLASEKGWAFRFVFCDYRSERYCATDPHSSERFAQRLLSLAKSANLRDGDTIPFDIVWKLREFI